MGDFALLENIWWCQEIFFNVCGGVCATSIHWVEGEVATKHPVKNSLSPGNKEWSSPKH